MAKSLRSKSRKKNNQAKREMYNEREIQQLKKTLGLTREAERIRREEIMKDWTEISAAIQANEKITMTKSLRSKSKRKSSTPVKRELRFSNQVEHFPGPPTRLKDAGRAKPEEIMKDWTAITAPLGAPSKSSDGDNADVPMEINGTDDGPKETRLKITHPIWKNQRKIKAAKKKAQKVKKNKKKPGKKITKTKVGKNKK